MPAFFFFFTSLINLTLLCAMFYNQEAISDRNQIFVPAQYIRWVVNLQLLLQTTQCFIMLFWWVIFSCLLKAYCCEVNSPIILLYLLFCIFFAFFCPLNNMRFHVLEVDLWRSVIGMLLHLCDILIHMITLRGRCAFCAMSFKRQALDGFLQQQTSSTHWKLCSSSTVWHTAKCYWFC